jgi:DNA-binding transcriptional regulator YdaS (Cro superfamily)
MTPEQLAALNEAIKKGGGIVKLAKTMDVTISAIQQWRKRGVPPPRAKQLETATGVSRARLAPDVYA